LWWGPCFKVEWKGSKIPNTIRRSFVKLAVWLLTTKSRKSIRFSCVKIACDISLERFWWGLQLCFRPHLNQNLHTMLWHPKVAEALTLAISGFPFKSLRTKNHLDVGLVERCREYYKGEGGGFPQVRTMVSFVCPCCMWFILAPKVLPLCTNYFVLVLYRSVWVHKAYQLLLVPSWSSSTPLYPSKVLRARERASTSYSSTVFCWGFTFESLKELGVRHVKNNHSISTFNYIFFENSWKHMEIKLLKLALILTWTLAKTWKLCFKYDKTP